MNKLVRKCSGFVPVVNVESWAAADSWRGPRQQN